MTRMVFEAFKFKFSFCGQPYHFEQNRVAIRNFSGLCSLYSLPEFSIMTGAGEPSLHLDNWLSWFGQESSSFGAIWDFSQFLTVKALA